MVDLKRLLIYEPDKFPLDKLPPSSFAYSFRQVRSNFFGNANRIRRFDNTELDVGFTSQQELNLNRFLGFVRDGLIIRRNLLLHSESFDSAVWQKVAAGTGSIPVVTPNSELDPLGGMTADRAVFNLNGGTTTNDQSTILDTTVNTFIGAAYTYSIYLRTTDGSNVTVQLSAQGAASINYKITPSWQRFSLFYSSALDTVRRLTFRLRGTFGTSNSASLAVWGAQHELGTLTDYQPIGSMPNEGNSFLATWYDQSTNNKTISQATVVNQPRSSISGNLITSRNLMGMQFDSTDSLSGNGVSISYNGSAFSFSGATDIYPVFNGNTLLEVIGFDTPLSGQDKAYLLANQQRYYNL